MSSERDAGEMVSGATTLMVTGLTPDQLSVTAATDEAVQQATIQAVLQAAGQTGETQMCYGLGEHQGAPLVGSTLIPPDAFHLRPPCLQSLGVYR